MSRKIGIDAGNEIPLTTVEKIRKVILNDPPILMEGDHLMEGDWFMEDQTVGQEDIDVNMEIGRGA